MEPLKFQGPESNVVTTLTTKSLLKRSCQRQQWSSSAFAAPTYHGFERAIAGSPATVALNPLDTGESGPKKT